MRPWFLNVVMRLARVLTPDLKLTDLKERPEVFIGFLTARLLPLVHAAQGISLEAIPDGPLSEIAKRELAESRETELIALQETIAAASGLPGGKAESFFATLGGAIRRQTGAATLERIADNHTVQICLFLIIKCSDIEAGKFRSISAMFPSFLEIRSAFLGRRPLLTDDGHARLLKQFQKVCSADGVRFRRSGRPRRISPDA
jgi:hypothetical protein